jgi:hypothetical protein
MCHLAYLVFEDLIRRGDAVLFTMGFRDLLCCSALSYQRASEFRKPVPQRSGFLSCDPRHTAGVIVVFNTSARQAYA